MRSKSIDAAVAAALALFAALVYRKVVRLWWMYDDAFLLNRLRPASFGDLWHDRALYAKFGRPIFNPLLLVSLKLDLGRFGLDARAFYVHQLVSFALLAAMLYLLLRLWTTRFSAAAAVVVFTISGPTLQVVPQLMLRHYIEGAVLATGSVILFVLAVRQERWALSLASAFLYFCAAAAKEVYAPLLLILLVMPEGSWRRRLRFAVPHAVAASAFAVWRALVVGWSLEEFGFVVPPAKRPLAIAMVPVHVVRDFASSAAGWALLAIVLVCIAIVVVRRRGARLVLAVAIAAIVAPLIPVAAESNPRWAFAPWLLAVIAIALVPRAVALGAVVAAVIAFRAEWGPAYRLFLRMSDEARIFSMLRSDEILRNPATPAMSLHELRGLTGSPAWPLYDDLPLCNGTVPLRRLFEYDPAMHEVRETSTASLGRSCASIRRMPLELRLHFEPDGAFYWTLGPYRDGRWAFILWEHLAYEVPREGGFRSPQFEHFDLRVRYTSPAGWTTYSSLLEVDPKKGPINFRQ